MMNFLDRSLTYVAGTASGLAIGIVSMAAICVLIYYKEKDEEEGTAEE